MSELTAQNRDHRYLQVFQQVTRMIATVRDPQRLMEDIVRHLPDLLAIDACTIRLQDGDTGRFVLGAAFGLSDEYLARPDVDAEETLAMVSSGKPVAMEDAALSPHRPFREAAAHEGIVSVLTLPISFQGRVSGIMRLLSRSRRSFADDEIAFALALAEQTGIAIANGRFFSQLERQVDYFQEIQAISRLVNSTLDLDVVLTTIVEMLPRSMNAHGCTIRLLTPESNRLELAASFGLSREYLDRGEVVDEQNTIMALQGEPVAILDVAADERVLYHDHMVREGIKSLLAVPIKVKGEVIGIIRILARQRRRFSQAEINFSLAVAEVGGAAIINAGTYRKITLLFNQIEEHERFLGNIIDCIGAQLLVFDRQLRVVVANRAFLSAHGLTEAEALGMSYGQLCQAKGEEKCCPVDDVLFSGKPGWAVQERREDDEVRWYERTATPLENAAGEVEYVIEIIHDITAERRLKSAEAERAKLEGVVELAGTVAHEINSPLFAALGMAQLLQDDVQGEEKEAVETIVRNLKAIAGLTAKMTRMTGYRSRDYAGETRIMDLE